MWWAVLACVATEPAFLPATGSVVPPNPTIYVVMPPSLRGASVPDSVTVATEEAYDILRVDVRASEGDFEIVAGDRVARYRIGPWRAHAEVVEARVFGSWQSRFTIAGNATVLRMLWTDGSDTMMPIDHGWARIGHLDCIGSNVPWTRLVNPPRPVVLFARFPDGSEHRLGSGIVSSDHIAGFVGGRYEAPAEPPASPMSFAIGWLVVALFHQPLARKCSSRGSQRFSRTPRTAA